MNKLLWIVAICGIIAAITSVIFKSFCVKGLKRLIRVPFYTSYMFALLAWICAGIMYFMAIHFSRSLFFGGLWAIYMLFSLAYIILSIKKGSKNDLFANSAFINICIILLSVVMLI